MPAVVFVLRPAFLLLILACLLAGCAAEPPQQRGDPWIGLYRFYPRSVYAIQSTGQFGKAEGLTTISKDSIGYLLGETTIHFKEVKRGVLSDGQGGLGKITASTVKDADGKIIPILDVDLCYVQFVLCRDLQSEQASLTKPQGR